MDNLITATFLKRRYQDSGRDQAPDYFVYEFTNIEDQSQKRYSD